MHSLGAKSNFFSSPPVQFSKRFDCNDAVRLCFTLKKMPYFSVVKAISFQYYFFVSFVAFSKKIVHGLNRDDIIMYNHILNL